MERKGGDNHGGGSPTLHGNKPPFLKEILNLKRRYGFIIIREKL
jgi:hypothetical protein